MIQDDTQGEIQRLRERIAELENAQGRLAAAEDALRQSEERFRLLYESVPLGYQSLDEDGRLLEVNKAWLDTLGYARDEVIGKWFGDFLAPEFVDRFRAYFPRFKDAGEIRWVEFDMLRKDGARLSAVFDGRIAPDSSGRFRRTYCVLRDVTELKRSHQALRESEERYRLIVETANEGVWVVDKDFRTTFVNQRLADMLGLGCDDMLGQTVNVFMHKDDLEDHWTQVEKRRLGIPAVYERRYVRKDGSLLWARVSASVLKNSEGMAVGSFAMLTDITESKRMEQALRESEETSRLLSETTFEAICFHYKGVLLYANRQYFDMSGYEPQELLGKEVLSKTVAPESRAAVQKRILEGSEERYEILALKKDGTQFPVEVQSRVSEYQGKSVRATAIRDITERKRTEDALRTSEETINSLLQAAPVSIGIVAERRLEWVNDFTCKMLGYSQEELLGQSPRILYASDEESERVKDIKYHSLQTTDCVSLETRWQRKDGQMLDVLLTSAILRLETLPSPRVISTAIDITELKQAEENLKKSGEWLQLAQDFARAGTWEWDLTTNENIWSDEVWRLYGLTPHSRQPSYKAWRDAIHPDDRDEVERKALAAASTASELNAEWRTNNSSGEPRWLMSRGRPLCDTDGRTVRFLGLVVDITDRKTEEARVKRSLQEKEALLREIHHRVKNNLAVISSLLGLQADRARDETHKRMFGECQSRVRSMALAHELVYQSEDLAEIPVSTYVRNIIDHLVASTLTMGKSIDVRHNIRDVPLRLDTAIPLGFLLTELFSNCLKHAFPGDRTGSVDISFGPTGNGEFELVVKDDGIGFQGEEDPVKFGTLGLDLIDTAVRTLRGNIEFLRGTGTEARIRFAEAPRRRRA